MDRGCCVMHAGKTMLEIPRVYVRVNMMMKEQTDFLRDAFPEFQNKIPSREAPTWLLKLFAFLRPPLKMIAPELGKNRKLDSSRARELLGWKPRPAKEAIKAAADSLIKFDSLN